jgi:serine/threonine protein phosphatase PrpC
VYPGRLSVSRTLGDIDIKKSINGEIISSKPDLFTVDLGNTNNLLMMSDGVYEQMTNYEIANHFLESEPK